MRNLKRYIPLIMIAVSVQCPSWAVQDENLSPSEIVTLHRLIKPTEAESQFLKIPWMTTIHHARTRAAREGKPLMIFMIHGHLLAGC